MNVHQASVADNLITYIDFSAASLVTEVAFSIFGCVCLFVFSCYSRDYSRVNVFA